MRLRIAASAACVTAAALGVAVASSIGATTSIPRTVNGSLIKRPNGTLAPGTVVQSSTLGQRVFTTDSNGFALANVGGAQYPAATFNAGKVWKTNGPALHLDAAQGPLAVTSIGVINRNRIYAYGSGSAVDATSDGGKHWYQGLFQGESMAVVQGLSTHLVAYFDGTSNGKGTTWQYVSKNGGQTWKLDSAVGGS